MNAITYTVTYRVPGFLRRKVTLKNVIGDGIEPGHGFRFFTLLDGRMIHVPLATEVEFAKERTIAIESKIRKEAGH